MPRPPIPEETILTAAADLFGERGYQGTTTAAIAERAGVNEVTIFRRFGSKQGLLAALAKHWAANMAGMAVDLVGGVGDVRSTLGSLVRMEFDGAERHGVAAMRLVMEASSSPEIAEVMGDNPHRNLDGLARFLQFRQSTGEVRPDLNPWVMAEAFFAMTSTQVIAREMLHLGNRSGETRDEVIRQLVELFCAGILTDGHHG
jgi:AcrR family transcriptional regulator